MNNSKEKTRQIMKIVGKKVNLKVIIKQKKKKKEMLNFNIKNNHKRINKKRLVTIILYCNLIIFKKDVNTSINAN